MCLLHYTIQYYTMLYHVIVYHTILYTILIYHTILYNIVVPDPHVDVVFGAPILMTLGYQPQRRLQPQNSSLLPSRELAEWAE